MIRRFGVPFVFLVVVLAPTCEARADRVATHLVSEHVEARSGSRPYNEVNPGVGVELDDSTCDALGDAAFTALGGYLSSYLDPVAYAACGAPLYRDDRVRVAARAGVAFNYPDDPVRPLGTLSLSYRLDDLPDPRVDATPTVVLFSLVEAF